MAENFIFELERFLPYRLSVLANTVRRGISQSYLERYGISITEWRVIAVLGPNPGLTASEIMQRTAMEKVPISRAVKALMNTGLVPGTRDPGDRRCRRLQLSARGQAVFDDIIPRAMTDEEALLTSLTQQETRQLTRLLDSLQTRANKLNTNPA